MTPPFVLHSSKHGKNQSLESAEDTKISVVAALTAEVLQDHVAVSLARAMATANKHARELGVDVIQSLITITQHISNGTVLWRVNYGPRDYVGRRGGDLIIEVDPFDASIRQVLRGQ